MGSFPKLVLTSVGTVGYDYKQALADTADQRAKMDIQARAEVMALLEQRSSLNAKLEQKTNDLLSTILMVAKLEQQISELQPAEMEEYAIALLLLKLKPDKS